MDAPVAHEHDEAAGMFSASELHSALVLAADESGANDIPAWHVGIAFLVIVIESIVCRALQTAIGDQLFVSGVRALVQLSCLGWILYPIFSSNSPALVLAYIFGFMVLVSANEVSARPKVTYPGIYRNAVIAMGTGMLSAGSLLLCIVSPTPWYNAQYLIPLAGMLINNSLTGTALAMDQMIDYLMSQKEYLEVLLAFGATPQEAAWPGFVKAFRAAMIPAINGMNVIGIVSIPGMMTGQVLGGASPAKAARYQIIITFMISGCTTTCVCLICLLTIRAFFDPRGRLDTRKVTKQGRIKIAQLFEMRTWRRTKNVTGSATSSSDPLLADVATEVPSALLLKEEPSGGPSTPEGREVVLDVAFTGNVARSRLLKVSLRVRKEDIICVMGPSGIGKSTLLRMLSDLQAVEELRSASLGDRLLAALRPQAWRQEVLYVHQSKAPVPGTPAELLSIVQSLKVNSGKRAFDPLPAMRAMGLEEGFLKRGWAELSGGEAQRMMCAIALSTQPSCILLDEPTSALDDAAKRLVEQHLQSLTCGVVLVTHDEQQAKRVATRIARLVPE